MIKIRKTKKIDYTAIDSFLPRIVTIPLKQESFDDCDFTVSIGSYVKEGQCLSKPIDSNNSLVSAVHSSVPGVVEGIEKITLFDGRESKAVKIKMQGAFSYRGKEPADFNWKIKMPSEIIKMISDYGVINTFFINKPSSLAAQLNHRNKDSSKIIVVRLFDEDPYRCTDSFVSENLFDKIRQGAAILAYAYQASGIVFAYNKNKPSPEIKEEDEKIFGQTPVKYIPVNCEKYPAGFQRILMEYISKNFPEDEVFSKINIYDLMTDSVTLVHLYNAIVQQIPVISQYVYIYGDCLKISGILRVPIGISLEFLVDECGGFLKQPTKIIINGQLTGWKVNSSEYPVTKNIKSIGFLSKASFPNLTANECIRCGKCRMVCPAGLCPDVLFNQVITQNEVQDSLLVKSSALCSSCSLCNSVCSSRLPLSQIIALIREHSYENPNSK